METPEILLVESDGTTRDRLAAALRDFRFAVTPAASAEAALRILRPSYSSLVVEVDLPDLSGLDLLDICARLSPATRVVILARQPRLEDALAAFRAGAVDYLVKPFPMEQLLQALWRAGSHADVWSDLTRTEPGHCGRAVEGVAAYERSLALVGSGRAR